MKTKRNASKPQKFTSYQKLVVMILTLLQFAIILDLQIIMPLGDMLMKNLAIDTIQFGLLISCYAFGAGIMGIVTSIIADKFDRKIFLLFFCFGFISGTFLCGLSNNYYTLLVARSLTGLFGGVISSISMTIVSDLFALDQRGRVMSYIQLAFSVSQVLGLPAGIFIANRWGWHMAFYAIVVLAVVLVFAIVILLKPIVEHKKNEVSENLIKRMCRILSTKSYQTGLLFIAIVSISGAMILPYSATFFINNMGIMQDQLPIIYTCTGIATIIIIPLIGKLSDQVDKYKMFVVGSLFSILITLIFTQLTPIPLWSIIIINIFIFIGISSCSIPAMSLITEVPQTQDRGSYMGLGESLQLMANGIGTIVAGSIINQPSKFMPLQHFEWLGYIVSVISIFSIFLLSKINSKARCI